MPAVLNAANEVAVRKFLSGTISFSDIPKTIERAMKHHQVISNPALDEILEADEWARAQAESYA